MVRVSSVAAMKIATNTISPTTRRSRFEKVKSETRRYVKAAAIIDEKRILAEDAQSTETPNRFLMKRKPMSKLGRPAVKVVTINPMTPKREINTKPIGKPIPHSKKSQAHIEFCEPLAI